MMVDYSDWLNSLPGEFHLNTGWFLVIAIVSVSVMFLILARCRDLTDSLGWEKCQACITSLIIAAWAIGLLWFVNYNRNGATVLDVHGKDGTDVQCQSSALRKYRRMPIQEAAGR